MLYMHPTTLSALSWSSVKDIGRVPQGEVPDCGCPARFARVVINRESPHILYTLRMCGHLRVHPIRIRSIWFFPLNFEIRTKIKPTRYMLTLHKRSTYWIAVPHNPPGPISQCTDTLACVVQVSTERGNLTALTWATWTSTTTVVAMSTATPFILDGILEQTTRSWVPAVCSVERGGGCLVSSQMPPVLCQQLPTLILHLKLEKDYRASNVNREGGLQFSSPCHAVLTWSRS